MLLEELIKEAQDELKEWAQGEVVEYEVVPDEVSDTIFEITDSSTPVYYSDMMKCANDDYSLMHETPELASGDETPMRALQLNIFDRIENELCEYWEVLKDELQDDLDEYENLVSELEDIAEDPDRGLDDALEAWGETDLPEYMEKSVGKHMDELFAEED